MKWCLFAVALVGAVSALQYAGELLWTHNHDSAIYESCAISDLTYSVAGAGYNDVNQCDLEAASLSGDGTPSLVWEHQDVEVCGNPTIEEFAAIGYISATMTTQIYKWNSVSSTEPDQTFTVPGRASPADGGQAKHAIQIADKTLIGAAVTVYPDAYSYNARAYWFVDGDLSNPQFYDSENLTSVREVLLTTSGDKLAYVAGSRLVVINTDSGTLLMDEDFGFSTDALCMSGDGSYIGYGFSTFELLKWNTNTQTYELLWTSVNPGWYVGACAISADSSTLVVTYFTGTYKQNSWSIWDLKTGTNTPMWSYKTAVDTGSGQDAPWCVGITRDGTVFAVASWGDTTGSVPQIQLFDRDTASPFFTQTTPGSMFTLDISEDEKTGIVYVTAGGKHVHANVMGKGGDLFAIRAVPVK
ncbi:hypothetical protein Pelo_4757 [Pelomyxa schiedti]|nr:hypothetical protein Pelo_4757 [Pelomyxa schiedti]